MPGIVRRLWPGFESDRVGSNAVPIFLAVMAGLLVGSVVWQPTKRNIEVLAGAVFLGTMLVADPFRALLFTLILIPYPAYTSVGSTSMLLIFALAAVVLIQAKQLRLPSPFARRDADLALMGFGLMLLLSLYPQPAEGMTEAILLLSAMASAFVLYYVVIYLCATRDRLWNCVAVSQYVLFSLAVLGIFQWLFPERQLLPEFFSFSRMVADREEIIRGKVRVTATFNGQELFAEYLAISSILQYVLFRRARGVYAKTLWVVISLATLAALFATATRGALIVLVFGFLYMMSVGGRVIPRFQMFKIVFLALALFYLAFETLTPLVDHMLSRIATIGSQDSSIQSRSKVLAQAFKAIADSPLLGHGFYIPFGTFTGGVTRNIHNLYVTLAYCVGIPGLVAFLWFVIDLWKASWRTMYSRSASHDLRELSLALNTGLVMFVVDQIKIEFTREALTMHLAFMLFAWQVAVWRVAMRERQGEFSEYAGS